MLSLQARTIAVPADYPSIKAAVRAARDGDVVEVADGIYPERDIVLDKKITLRSKNRFGALICGRGAEPGKPESALIWVRGEALIEGFVLRHGCHGIVQRDSPDVRWRARDLFIYGMHAGAIVVNDRNRQVGHAEVERLVIEGCGQALATNDAGSLRAEKVIVDRSNSPVSYSNHGVFRIDRMVAWDCERFVSLSSTPRDGPQAAGHVQAGPAIYCLEKMDTHVPHQVVSAERAAGLIDQFLDIRPSGKVSNPGGRALACLVKGDLFDSRREPRRALGWYQEAARRARESGLTDLLWQAEFGCALAHVALGEAGDAEAAFRRSLDAVSEAGRLMNVSLYTPPFHRGGRGLMESYVDHLCSLQSKAEPSLSARRAFEAADGAKTLMPGLKMIEAAGDSPNVRKCLRDISGIQQRLQTPGLDEERYAALRERLTAAEDGLTDALRSLKKKREGKRPSDDGREEALDWSGLQATLGRNRGAVLAFAVGPNLTFGFYVDRRNVVLRRLGRSSEIMAAVSDFLRQKQVGNTASSSGREGGEALFGMLLSPFAGEMERNSSKLLICPDDLLHYLPFEALVWPSAGKSKQGRFLLETHQVSYIPSVRYWQDLLNRRERSRKDRDLLALGNSEAPIEDFRRPHLPLRTPPLRYAAAEAAAVAREYDRRSRVIMTGREARESALKSAAARPTRMLHIAAHGIYDDYDWWRSALVLGRSADGDEDGLLSPLEVAMMSLDIELVILSGCRTNLGLVHQGGGVSGFTQAFLKAGARAVISSDWSVDDRSTAMFMKDFHGHIALGWQPAAALRQVKLNFLRTKFKHPFYWAAYVLTGDGGWKP